MYKQKRSSGFHTRVGLQDSFQEWREELIFSSDRERGRIVQAGAGIKRGGSDPSRDQQVK
jgi:hypothetical protein